MGSGHMRLLYGGILEGEFFTSGQEHLVIKCFSKQYKKKLFTNGN